MCLVRIACALNSAGEYYRCAGGEDYFEPTIFVLDAATNVLSSFAAISSIINAAWVREGAVVYGSLCTAQGNYGNLFTRSFANVPSRCPQAHVGRWHCSLVSRLVYLGKLFG